MAIYSKLLARMTKTAPRGGAILSRLAARARRTLGRTKKVVKPINRAQLRAHMAARSIGRAVRRAG